MKAWMKALAGVLLVVALAAVVVPVTSAQEGEPAGSGWILAHGSGEAILDGDGHVTIHGRGAAVVWVSGAEALSATGRGRRVDLPDGTVRFEGWQGTIWASGEGMHVRMLGGIISFYAAGSGTVFLRGHGWYRTGNRAGPWPSGGGHITLE